MPKQTLAIIAGGKSPEHEISLISAFNILSAVDKSKFDCLIIGISKSGKWFMIPENQYSSTTEIGDSDVHEELLLQPFSNPVFYCKRNPTKSYHPDVLFPITHGVYGEDGTLQGLLTHLDIPFVGSNVLGSAIGMDKDITKKLAKLAGVRVTPSETHHKGDKFDLSQTIINLGLPLFVKPVNMGSGVGVIKAADKKSLEIAIETAFQFDTKILIEKAIVGRELETAVLGNNSPKVTSVGEIVIKDDFYTYENKYENDKAKVVIPAENLSKNSVALIQEMALTTYKALELEGLSRVDFFYVSDAEIYLNEVNTLPGFTNISMYPKLWENVGLKYTELITELVNLALERFHEKAQLQREK